MTEAVVRIRGRNELGRAVAAAERDLKKLANTGQLVTKFLKGGAIIAVARQLEVLAERAQEAAEAIGDKGTAGALKQLNDQIDRRKAEAMTNFGKALILLAGPEAARIAVQMESIRKEMIWLQEHGEAGGSRYKAIFNELRELEARLEAMGAAASASTVALRRMQAISRGNVRPIEEWWNKTAKEDDLFPDVVTAQRAGLTAMESFYADAERATRTTTENIFDEWLRLDLQLAELQTAAAGQFRISAEEAAKRMSENTDKFLEPIVVTAHRMAKPIAEVSQLAIDAANEMRNAFAEFLTTSSDDIDDWAANFIDALREILAQAAATQLFSFLSTTSPALSFLAPRAMGGPVKAGGSYLVGERGPEWFVPNTSGNIVPGGGGGLVVAPVYNIDARGATTDLLRILPQVLEQNKRETVALAVQATRNRVERTGHL